MSETKSGLKTPFDQSTRFERKRLHLGVCGSVACYKAADLLRAWSGMGIHVSATLTPGARRFVAPLLFESLGAAPVYEDMFTAGQDVFSHLEPGQHAQAMVVAPASADALFRLAHGAASGKTIKVHLAQFDLGIVLVEVLVAGQRIITPLVPKITTDVDARQITALGRIDFAGSGLELMPARENFRIAQDGLFDRLGQGCCRYRLG